MIYVLSKPRLLQTIAALAVVLFVGALLLLTVAGAQPNDCKDCDDGCDGHGESVCSCIGCAPVMAACRVLPPELGPPQTHCCLAPISPLELLESDWFDRLDRPPQTLS